jgi:hypothetical protein
MYAKKKWLATTELPFSFLFYHVLQFYVTYFLYVCVKEIYNRVTEVRDVS